MSRRLRLATSCVALALLAGCAQVPADSIPGSGTPSTPPALTTVASPTPTVSPTPQAGPPSPSAVAAQATSATGGGTDTAGGNGGGGSGGSCAADEYRNVDGV